MSKLLIIVLLTVPVGWSAPTYVQSHSAYSGGTAVSSQASAYTSNNTAGNLLIVFVDGIVNSGTLTAFNVTDTQGNTWLPATSLYGISQGVNPIQMFYVANCKAGANTVTVTSTGATLTFFTVKVHEYSGIALTSPIDTTASAFAFSGNVSVGPITTSVANELIFVGAFPNTVVSAGTGFTIRENFAGSATEDENLVSPGSVTGTMNVTGSWGAQMVAFKPASASATTGRIWVE